MARSRNIKPGFFTNEVLAELPFDVRLLFIGLWTIADRDGRLEDRVIRIRMTIFPADSVDVEAGLQALHDSGFILRYAVDGARYIQILAWAKHQNPHYKEVRSVIPAPQMPEAFGLCVSTKPEACTGIQDGKAPDKPEALPPVHDTKTGLIPDSLNLIPDSRALEQRAARLRPKCADRFDEFWAEYPVKKGKADALKTWAAKRLDGIADQIIADVKRRKAEDRQWLDGYAPHGSTYVHGRGWEDAIEPVRNGKRDGGDTPDYAVGAI